MKNHLHYWFITAVFFFSSALVACSELSPSEQAELLTQLRSSDDTQFVAALSKITETKDTAFISPLIDLLWSTQIGIDPEDRLPQVESSLQKISGEIEFTDWTEWVTWQTDSPQSSLVTYPAWKGELLGSIDPDFADFFIDPIDADFQVAEIVWGGVAKDGIPSLDHIEQIPITEARGYSPKDVVFGISINGDHRAYPLRIMDWHEMANDVVGGVPISLTYCTLCGSAIVYETTHSANDTPLEFGSSGLLYRSNKLMYDRQTNSIWSQLTGKPVMGSLVGKVNRLELVPVVITTIEEWTAQHPDATILPLVTGFIRDYTPGTAYGEYFVRDTILFPIGDIDERLEPKEQVFALEIDGAAKAYPLNTISNDVIINDSVGNTNVVLIAASNTLNVYGYSYELEYITYSAGGEIRAFERGEHTFEWSDSGEIVDESGAVWTVTEDYLVQENQDSLARLSGHISFWFGWQSFFPETDVYINKP